LAFSLEGLGEAFSGVFVVDVAEGGEKEGKFMEQLLSPLLGLLGVTGGLLQA
jgi:hypothetical protein